MNTKLRKAFFILVALFVGVTSARAATILFPYGGGTGTSAAPSANQVLVGNSNGTYGPSNLILASSTIGNGTQAGGLTISGGATTTANAYFGASVGIGTSNPLSLLHLYGGSGNSQILFTNSTTGVGSGGYIGQLAGGNNLFYVNQTSTGSLYFGTNNTTRIVINSSGSVGVGTTTPAAKLDVNGNIVVEGSNGAGDFSGFNDGLFFTGGTLGSVNNPGALITAINDGSWGADIQFATRPKGGGTGQERMRITENGNIGFASTTPAKTLSVQGDALVSGTTTTGALVATSTITYQGVAQSPYNGVPLFGDGVDGNVTISSGTTTLTGPMMYNNLTLSGTGALRTNGSVIYVAGTLDISNAKRCAINDLPNAGSHGATGSTGGAAGGGGFPSTGQDLPVSGGNIGLAGGSGTVTTGGSAANAGFNQGANTYTLLGGLSGAGGNGGASTNAAGTGGVPSVPNNGFIATNARFVNPLTWAGKPEGSNSGNNSASFFASDLTNTPGGGAGGGDGTNAGGGGGGGGSVPGALEIIARYINRGASTAVGAICDVGISGGDGAAGTAGNAGGGGGGAGGGGGFVYIAAEQLLGSTATNAIDVSGGNGGNGGAGVGTGSSGSGGWGGNGGGYQIRIFNPATFTIGTVNVATSTSPSGTSPGLGATVQANL